MWRETLISGIWAAYDCEKAVTNEYVCTGAVDPDPYNGEWWENVIALTFYGVAEIGFKSDKIEDLKEVSQEPRQGSRTRSRRSKRPPKSQVTS